MNFYHPLAIFRTNGVDCSIASGGKKALEFVRSRAESHQKGDDDMYRLILLDYSMPDLEGP